MTNPQNDSYNLSSNQMPAQTQATQPKKVPNSVPKAQIPLSINIFVLNFHRYKTNIESKTK